MILNAALYSNTSDITNKRFSYSPMVVNELDQAIGFTPFVRLNRISRVCQKHDLYLKMESCCLTGSIKDKNAAYLIQLAEKQGDLEPGGTIIESSSGNFGIALAALGAAKGYKVVIVIDAKTPPPIKKMLLAYGAQLESVPLELADAEGSMQKARMNHAKRLAMKTPGAFYPCQHLNKNNPGAHELYTAQEIHAAFQQPPDAIVVGISTAGQIAGIINHYRKQPCSPKIIAVDVAGSAVLGQPRHPYKMTGLGLSFVPPSFQSKWIHQGFNVSDQMAFSMCHHLAKQEGMLLGGSTGAIVSAGLAYANTLTHHERIVLVNPDRGDRYLETLYDEQWLQDNALEVWSHARLLESINHLHPIRHSQTNNKRKQHANS